MENLSLCVPRPSPAHGPRLVRSPKPVHCPPNHVLIRVDRFGFSANNVTYQALGEHPHFRSVTPERPLSRLTSFQVFRLPPRSGSRGRLSDHSRHLPRLGFWHRPQLDPPKNRPGRARLWLSSPHPLSPPASLPRRCQQTRLLRTSPTSSARYVPLSPYLPQLNAPRDRRPYNQIIRCAADPQYTPTPAAEDLTMLYRPLFWTSYWCEDWLFLSNYRGGASTILLSSASSKTAFCLAYLIQKRIGRGEVGPNLKVVGLTSKGNLEFTSGLGLYHDVLEYGSFTSSPMFQIAAAEKRWIYIDLASNDSINQRIFNHFASPNAGTLLACIVLGVTTVTPTSSNASTLDWNTNTFTITNNTAISASSPPQSENFFMVEWLDIRRHQLSPSEIFGRQARAWKDFMQDGTSWVKIDHVRGGDAVKQAYEAVAKNGISPEKGLIWSLWDEDENHVASKL